MAWVYHNKPPMGWPLDLSEPINDGLVGYWLMNEGTGNQGQDLSGNEKTGILTDITWVSGKSGAATLYNGSSTRIDATPFSIAEPFTLVASFLSTSVNTFVMGVGDKEDFGQYHSMRISAGFLLANTFDGTTSESSGGNSISLNTWHQGTVVFASASHRVGYLDGVTGTPNTDTRSVTDIDRCTIGATPDSTPLYFANNGQIEWVMIYNRALSASEIALLSRFPYYGFLNPDEVPVLDQYYTVTPAGIVVLRRRIEAA